MGQFLLRKGFSFKRLCDSITILGSNGKVYEPTVYNAQGIALSAPSDIEFALQNGGVFLQENTSGKNKRTIFCAMKDDGNLAISDPVATDLEAALKAKEATKNAPSSGRRLAYKLFGWIGAVKKSLADVAEYEENKKLSENSIDKLKESWEDHVKNDTIPSFDTPNRQDGIFSERLAAVSEEMRQAEPFVPGKSPIDPHFMNKDIMSTHLYAEFELRIHANERAEACLNAIATGALEEEYPDIVESSLSESQTKILKEGLNVRSKMFQALGSQKKFKPLDINADEMARLAEAQFVHKLTLEAQKNPQSPAAALLEMLSNPENEERFRAELASKLTDQYKVEDVFMLLETKEGAAIFNDAVQASLTKVELVSTEPGNIKAQPSAEMQRPEVHKVKQPEPEVEHIQPAKVLPDGTIQY